MLPRVFDAGGELDVALIGQEGAVAAREFYSHKLCSLGVCAALAVSDPLAGRKRIAIKELKPRFAVITDGITPVLSQVVSESAVTLLPEYFRDFKHPGVVFVPVADAKARWDFIVLWQRGKVPATTRALVEALSNVGESIAGARR